MPRRRRGAGVVVAALALAALTDPHGAAASSAPASPTVAAALSATGGGWDVGANGEVTAWGGAPSLGGLSGYRLDDPVVGIASTPSGNGYWLVARDGGVFSFGDARFFGSTGGIRLQQPIVGMAATPTGNGYWLVASDGGVFTFGDARFFGSTGGIRLQQPIVGMAATPTGNGYWLVARDGGVFTFGDAHFFGSTGGIRLQQPIVGMAATPTGNGYWLVAGDGGVFTFGKAPFEGSLASTGAGPVVSVSTTTAASGYVLVNRSGSVYPFGAGVSAASRDPHPGTVTAASTPTTVPTPVLSGGSTFFSASSPLNQTISTSTFQQGSSQLVSSLVSHPTADLYAFGAPIYTDVTASTPRYSVSCTENWGTCPLSRQLVPIPADAVPSSGSDGEMVIVDPATHLGYEFWQARRSGNTWVASWGAVVSTTGPGDVDIYGGPGGTGSGLSQLAGVATVAEMEAGVIPHALSFSSSLTCSTYVYPATKSDGSGSAPNCLPEGARIQLDPSVDLAAIPGITPFELTVGRALQQYGAFCRDTGGASMAFIFQVPDAGAANPYPGLGASEDYYNMPHIPWNDIRVVSG